MDAVNVERLIQRFRDNGELENEDPALLLLKQWPECKKYKDNPEKLAGLKQKVYIYIYIYCSKGLNVQVRVQHLVKKLVKKI